MKYLGTNADQKDAIAREYIDSKLAPVETSPATAAHTAGSLLLYNGTLYRATADIAVGATLTVGTNIAATDLNEVASLLKSAINAKADIDLGITGAIVGQFAKIKTVDDGGKPTAWEYGSGGGASIDLGITGASVGQVATIKTVDGNGKPTEWSAASKMNMDNMELLQKVVAGYSITTNEPNDWATNYTDYYINTGTNINPTYTSVVGETAPTWEPGTFYSYDPDASFTCDYFDSNNKLRRIVLIRTALGTLPSGTSQSNRYFVRLYCNSNTNVSNQLAGYLHQQNTKRANEFILQDVDSIYGASLITNIRAVENNTIDASTACFSCFSCYSGNKREYISGIYFRKDTGIIPSGSEFLIYGEKL